MAMIVIEKNTGAKIVYSVRANKITFDDELTINVERYERDDPAHIDVCRDRFGNLVTGVIPGIAEKYVAQIDIPARAYTETVIEAPAPAQEDENSGYNGGMDRQTVTREPVPFDMSKCTLTLWGIGEEE